MSSLEWSWTATLSTEQLGYLQSSVLTSQVLSGLRLWVTPTEDPERPHRVRLVLPAGDPGNSIETLQFLDQRLQANRIEM